MSDQDDLIRKLASIELHLSSLHAVMQAEVQIREYVDMGYTVHSAADAVFSRDESLLRVADGRCVVCKREGPGLTELPNGTIVHRWPCRDRLLG